MDTSQPLLWGEPDCLPVWCGDWESHERHQRGHLSSWVLSPPLRDQSGHPAPLGQLLSCWPHLDVIPARGDKRNKIRCRCSEWLLFVQGGLLFGWWATS